MGIDVDYQAVPADGRLVELARRDVEDGWGLSMLPYRFRHSDADPPRMMPNRIYEAADEIASNDPAIRSINFDTNRAWDALHYLLSATYRGQAARETDPLIERAFDGGDLIAEHVCSSIGMPVLHISAPDVAAIAGLLKPMTDADLISHYDPVRMEAEGVYKLWADRVPEDTLPGWISHSFAGFRAFFVAAAEGGYAAIRCTN